MLKILQECVTSWSCYEGHGLAVPGFEGTPSQSLWRGSDLLKLADESSFQSANV